MIKTYTPFTYLLKFKPTGQLYYGVRFAKKCNPSELWTTYFTSSRVIKNLIAKYGRNAFDIEIRKTFETKDQAVLWESRVLKKIDAATNSGWLNKSNGDSKFRACGEFTELHKQKISNALSGRVLPDAVKQKLKGRKSPKAMLGKKHSEETKQKMSKSAIGRIGYWDGKIRSDDTKQKMSEAKLGRSLSEETKQKMSKPKSDLTRQKMTERMLNLPVVVCPHCRTEGKSLPMKRWHFENCRTKNENYTNNN